MRSTPTSQAEILVAVNFDKTTSDLVQAAAMLSKNSGQIVRLVHVLSRDLPLHHPIDEVDSPELASDAFGLGGPLMLGGRMTQASHLLNDLVSRYSQPSLELTSEVLVGDYPDTLTAFAAGRETSLIIVGAARRQPSLLKGWLRRTHRLMARAAVPVLVMQGSRTPSRLGEGRLRVLLSDDLTPSFLPAIRTVTALASLGVTADVLHMHVEAPAGSTEDNNSHQIWPGLNVADRLLDDHQDHVLDKLRRRAGVLRAKLADRSGTYSAELWKGSVRTEIVRAAKLHQADIAVFGQHHFFKGSPFILGQMPFASMLGIGSAILVAPGVESL